MGKGLRPSSDHESRGYEKADFHPANGILHRFYELMVDDQDDEWRMLKGADLKRYFSIVYECLLFFHGFIIRECGVKGVLYAFL